MIPAKTIRTDFGNSLGIELIAVNETEFLNAMNRSPDVDKMKASAFATDIHQKFLVPRVNNAEALAAAEIPGAESPAPEDSIATAYGKLGWVRCRALR